MRHFLTLLLLSLSFSSVHATDMHEAFGADDSYKQLYDTLEDLPRDRHREFKKKALKALNGDNAIGFFPRVLKQEDYDQVASAVRQRAKVIGLFLNDYFSGNHRYNKVIPEDILQSIVERSGELGYQGLISPKQIRFFYGPDMMQGHFLEDNLGGVGFFGDLLYYHEIMLRNNPEVLNYVNPNNPRDFYERLAKNINERAARKGGKAVVLVAEAESDKETYRFGKLLAQYGIETIFPNSKKLGLTVTDKGVFLLNKLTGSHRQKVGYLVLSGDHAWYDNTHPATWERAVMEAASELLRGRNRAVREKIALIMEEPRSEERLKHLQAAIRDTGSSELDKAPYPGIISAILKGQVDTNNTPGFEFVGDKQFYMYMPELTRFYLGEEPEIPNVPTKVFTDRSGRVNSRLIDKVFNNVEDYVIKVFDGRGGDGVWVGARMTKEKIKEVRAKVEANPAGYEFQEYLPPTGDYIYDLRVLGAVSVDNGKVSVDISDTGASRFAKSTGDGRVNESSGSGTAAAVLVDHGMRLKKPSSQRCRKDLFQ